MVEKRKRPKTTAAEVPEELLRHEILTRLPIKSVVRFKSVSKSWLSLFSQPHFVKLHHTHNATLNPVDYDCLVVDKGTKLVILTRYQETKLLPFDTMSFLIGSINGLVCLRRGNNLSLWNPAIHQSKEFGIPKLCSRVYGYNVGFGFDGASENFKVVVLSGDLRGAMVYYSGLESWRNVSVGENVFPRDEFKVSSASVIVKGCPYWICSRYVYENGVKDPAYLMDVTLKLVKFNAESDEFKLLPEYYFDAITYGTGGFQFCYQFVDMKDCLTLIVYSRDSKTCPLLFYSLCGEEEGCGVWSQMYILGPLQFETRGWYMALSQGFQYDGDILYHEHGIFSCLDHETEIIKRLRGTTSTDYAISCFRYAPTLVFIQGMKSVYLTTQTRRPGSYRTPRRLISSLRD